MVLSITSICWCEHKWLVSVIVQIVQECLANLKDFVTKFWKEEFNFIICVLVVVIPRRFSSAPVWYIYYVSALSLEFHPRFIVKWTILQYMLFRFNFFDFTDLVAVTTKPVLSGYGVFGVMAAISTSFNFKTMSTDSKPCQGSTVFNKICCRKSLCVSGSYISRPGLMLSTVMVDVAN